MRWAMAVLLAVGALGMGAAGAPAAPLNWALVSDVHFTPFLGASSAQVAALQAAPMSRWRTLLAAQGSQPSPLGDDTNAALLETTLRGLRRAAPRPRVVALTGDLLAHDFQKAYVAAMPTASTADYEAFVDKTISYLARRFDATYPRAQFLLTLGNNDSYCGDYMATPDSPFLLHTAQAWAPLVNRHGRAPGFVSSFRHLGSYTAKLPLRGLHAISVDDVFWSADYENTCGTPSQDPALDQANWLTRAMQGLPRGHRAWLATHIPMGIDVYATLSGTGAPVALLSPGGQAALASALDTGKVRQMLFGHLHDNTYRLGHGTPMLGVPSISPIFDNNPSFFVATVGSRGGILDYTAYALDVSRPGAAFTREYGFRDTYGLPAVDLASLQRLGPLLASNAGLRSAYEHYYVSGGEDPITEAQYRAYACGTTALDAAAFQACLGVS